MHRRFYLCALALLAIGGAVGVSLWRNAEPDESALIGENSYGARLKTLSDQPSSPAKPVPLAETKVVRLAIGSLGLADDSQPLADLVSEGLSNTQGLELVERKSLDKVLAELQMSISSLVRARDAIRVGKLLRADWFLLGTPTMVGETNLVVVRVVDARTGVLRDAAVLIASQGPTRLASNVVGFVRQCRRNASSGNQPVYLAIGTFQDFSINSRQAGFPTQLRGYLIGAFQNGPVTLLEREYVETLLQEVHLDLAGLTEENTNETPAPMQSAFWLVTGNYQSFETTNLQVEVDLEVARVFGRTERLHLTGEPGELLNRNIKTAIDKVMSQGARPIIPTRRSEVRLQMEYGKQLAGIDSAFGGPDLVYLGQAFNLVLDKEAALRKRRNAEEALRAFQTVLLLEPTNREARLYVAACLRNNTIQREEEARQYYREIIEGPLDDKWSDIARKALSASFGWHDSKAKSVWFEAAAGQTSSSTAADFYRREAEAAKADFLVKGAGPEAEARAETRLWASMTNSLLGSVAGPMGTEEFVNTFGTNRTAAALRLTELYPNLRSQAPQIAPYILAAIVSAQVDTNSPLVLEFQQLLEKLIEHPDQVFKPYDFWVHIQNGIWEWSWSHHDYRLATRLLEAKTAASTVFTLAASYTNRVPAIEITDKDRMRLAFAYLGTHQWDKALPLFESFSGQPFSMSMDGPWGRGGTVLFTGRLAEHCREELGLVVPSKRTEFELGKPVLQLCRDQAVTMDEGGLWTAAGDHVLHLDFELATNLVLNLPLENGAAVTAICATETNLWLGTDGDGLVQFDKATRQFRHLRQRDGLLMDKIASLYLTGGELWIGYGRRVREVELKSAGGLGKLDLRTGKSNSFMPALSKDPALDLGPGGPAFSNPSRNSVLAIAEGAPGEIWFLAEAQTPVLCRYRSAEEAWDIAVQQTCSCLFRDAQHLFVGRYWNYFHENKNGALGVNFIDLRSRDSAWREIKRPDQLPPGCVTALTADGGKLWVGGFGYIAAIDVESSQLQELAHVQAEKVDRLEIRAGFLWAQCNCCLYRVPLSTGANSSR